MVAPRFKGSGFRVCCDRLVRLLLVVCERWRLAEGVEAPGERVADDGHILDVDETVRLEVAEKRRREAQRPGARKGNRALVGERLEEERAAEGAGGAVLPQLLDAGARFGLGGGEAKLADDLRRYLGAGEAVGALEEAALDQRGDGGRCALQLELAPQLFRFGLAELDRALEDGRLEVGQLQVRDLVERGEGTEHHERPALEAGRQHERDAVEERGEVVVAEPAGELEVIGREEGPRVDEIGDVAGLGEFGLFAQVDDDALEGARAEGDVDGLAGGDRQSVWNAIGERLA